MGLTITHAHACDRAPLCLEHDWQWMQTLCRRVAFGRATLAAGTSASLACITEDTTRCGTHALQAPWPLRQGRAFLGFVKVGASKNGSKMGRDAPS